MRQQQQKASLLASFQAGLPQAVHCNTHTNDFEEIPLAIPIGGEQCMWSWILINISRKLYKIRI